MSTPSCRNINNTPMTHITMITPWRSRRTRVSARLAASLGTSPSACPLAIKASSRRCSNLPHDPDEDPYQDQDQQYPQAGEDDVLPFDRFKIFQDQIHDSSPCAAREAGRANTALKLWPIANA